MITVTVTSTNLIGTATDLITHSQQIREYYIIHHNNNIVYFMSKAVNCKKKKEKKESKNENI